MQQPLHQLLEVHLIHLTTVDHQCVDKCLLVLLGGLFLLLDMTAPADLRGQSMTILVFDLSIPQWFRDGDDLASMKSRQQLPESVPYIVLSLVVCEVEGECQGIKVIPRHCLWEYS